MVRVQGNKVSAVTGTKGYLWAEADAIEKEPERINKDYYRTEIDKAIECINQYGDFDEFVNVKGE